MTEPTPTAPVVPGQEPTAPATPPAAVTPPWGDPENFDAGKAWKLIEDLRADKEKLSSRSAVTEEQKHQLAEYQKLVDASKSEAQRQQEAVEKANRIAESATSEAIRYKAAATHGIGADHFDLLGTGSEEEITARAQKIASLVAAQVATTQTGTPPVNRPVEQLRPGATPAGAESEDDLILAKLFGPPTP